MLAPILEIDPSISLEFKDASVISKVFTKNSWLAEIQESNLFRGVMEEFGPILLTNGDNFKNAWTGRLIDFLSSQILKDEPIQLHYYLKDKLVSPFAIAIPEFNEKRLKVVSGITEKLLGDEVEQQMLDATNLKQKNSYKLRPLHLHSEKFATFREGNCLAIGRDPRVSIASGKFCASEGQTSTEEIVLRVRIDDFFPQIWGFSSKFYGFGKELLLNLKYKSWDKNLRVTKGYIKIADGFSFEATQFSPAIFDILPDQTVFFATFNTPFPDSLDQEGLKTFLTSSRDLVQKKPKRQVTLAAWNRRGSGKGTTHVTAVLVQGSKSSEFSIEGLPKIFSEKNLAEINFDRICEGYLVITPYLEALEDLRQACSKNIPVLSHKNPGIAKAFESDESSAQVYFDLAVLLTDSIKIGIQRTKELNALESPEVTKALQLLGQLPAFGFQGIYQNGSITFEEAL